MLPARTIMITRRHALKKTGLATAALAGLSLLPEISNAQAIKPADVMKGGFILPPLPYPVDALEPHIDAKTMEIHHGKHHAAYVNNLNKALGEAPGLFAKSISDLVSNLDAVPEKIRTAVRNNGGGHYNHSLFWQSMKHGGGGEPKGHLKNAIDQTFGSFSGFKEKFTEAATKVFGSGWAWLVLEGKQIKIESLPNQDTPLGKDRTPVLGLDVWEHAYYLRYQNRRADYIAAWYNVVDWDFVSQRFEQLNG
jgi:Fe-Mn family superoxide dismutase